MRVSGGRTVSCLYQYTLQFTQASGLIRPTEPEPRLTDVADDFQEFFNTISSRPHLSDFNVRFAHFVLVHS